MVSLLMQTNPHILRWKKNYFNLPLQWNINSVTIEVNKSINQLEVTLCNSPKYHVEKQIPHTRKAFNTQQALGFCEHGIKPYLKSYLWRTVLQLWLFMA